MSISNMKKIKTQMIFNIIVLSSVLILSAAADTNESQLNRKNIRGRRIKQISTETKYDVSVKSIINIKDHKQEGGGGGEEDRLQRRRALKKCPPGPLGEKCRNSNGKSGSSGGSSSTSTTSGSDSDSSGSSSELSINSGTDVGNSTNSTNYDDHISDDEEEDDTEDSQQSDNDDNAYGTDDGVNADDGGDDDTTTDDNEVDDTTGGNDDETDEEQGNEPNYSTGGSGTASDSSGKSDDDSSETASSSSSVSTSSTEGHRPPILETFNTDKAAVWGIAAATASLSVLVIGLVIAKVVANRNAAKESLLATNAKERMAYEMSSNMKGADGADLESVPDSELRTYYVRT